MSAIRKLLVALLALIILAIVAMYEDDQPGNE